MLAEDVDPIADKFAAVVLDRSARILSSSYMAIGEPMNPTATPNPPRATPAARMLEFTKLKMCQAPLPGWSLRPYKSYVSADLTWSTECLMASNLKTFKLHRLSARLFHSTGTGLETRIRQMASYSLGRCRPMCAINVWPKMRARNDVS